MINQLNKSQNIIKKAIKGPELLTLASYRNAWLLCKKKKPFVDVEFLREVLKENIYILTSDCDNKAFRKDLISKVDSIPLSRRSITRRVVRLSEEIDLNLKQNLQNCLFFSFCIDESCDITDIPQAVIHVRFITPEYEIKEELLSLTQMVRKRGEDFLSVFQKEAKKFNLDMTKLIGITTDGAPSLTGPKTGFVALMRKNYNLPNFVVSIHCFIHQENLVPKIFDEKDNEFKVLMDEVSAIAKFILSSDVHRFFKMFMKNLIEKQNKKESDDDDDDEVAQFSDLTYFALVRWLSRADVLNRVASILPHIHDFLDERNKLSDFEFINNQHWKNDLYFLRDVTQQLSNLNKQLQGNEIVINEFYSKIRSFIEGLTFKINMFKEKS